MEEDSIYTQSDDWGAGDTRLLIVGLHEITKEALGIKKVADSLEIRPGFLETSRIVEVFDTNLSALPSIGWDHVVLYINNSQVMPSFNELF